jgi:hypothetical protein
MVVIYPSRKTERVDAYGHYDPFLKSALMTCIYLDELPPSQGDFARGLV